MQGAGDRVSISELYFENKERLVRYLRARLANEEDVHELSQEAYLRILRVNRRLLIRNPQAYLFRIARNIVYEIYSARNVKVDGTVSLDTIEASGPSLEDITERAIQCREVERVIAELSPKCCAALLMHWKLGLTQKEIAEEMQLSRSMVQKYLATALAHCRKRLTRYRQPIGGHSE